MRLAYCMTGPDLAYANTGDAPVGRASQVFKIPETHFAYVRLGWIPIPATQPLSYPPPHPSRLPSPAAAPPNPAARPLQLRPPPQPQPVHLLSLHRRRSARSHPFGFARSCSAHPRRSSPLPMSPSPARAPPPLPAETAAQDHGGGGGGSPPTHHFELTTLFPSSSLSSSL